MLPPCPDLPRRLRAGEREAHRELAHWAGPALLQLAQRLLGDVDAARDVRQEALVRAIQRLDQLEDDARFGPWLMRLALNACRDHLRRERARSAAHERSADDRPESIDDDPARHAADLDERERVAGAVAALPELEREAVVLRHYHDQTLAEIAEVQDAPISTVQSRLVRGLRRLEEALRERDEHAEPQRTTFG